MTVWSSRYTLDTLTVVFNIYIYILAKANYCMAFVISKKSF